MIRNFKLFDMQIKELIDKSFALSEKCVHKYEHLFKTEKHCEVRNAKEIKV